MNEPVTAPKAMPDAELILTTLLEASPLAIITLDRETRVTSWNPAAERMFGWSAQEILGQPYPLVPDDLTGEYRAYVARGLAGDTPSTLVTRRKRKDGTFLDVRILAAPLRGPSGQVHALLGCVTDVSAERRLEAQLRQALKMEAVGQLAGGIAHDFNNILTVITSHCELLQQDGSFPPAYRSEVAAIASAAGRAADLTKQLLAFSRKQILKPKRLDLNQVAKGLQPMLSRLLGENIRVVLRLAEAGPVVLADRVQLDQIIVNLAVNARDAMPAGGKLRLETMIVEVDGNSPPVGGIAVPAGRYAVLTVQDSGVGMSPATLAHIFEPFFTTKELGKGTGLGLSTVYGIVKQSAGFIWADSEPGQGTTMKIYLPALDEKADPPTPPGVAAIPGRGSETVLVVEDESSLREIVARILRKHGFVVLAAGSVQEARQTVETHRGQIDVLLTDTVLPDGNGPSLASELLRLKRVRSALLTSGYADSEVVRRGLASDDIAFVSKPFTSATLLGAIRSVIDSANR